MNAISVLYYMLRLTWPHILLPSHLTDFPEQADRLIRLSPGAPGMLPWCNAMACVYTRLVVAICNQRSNIWTRFLRLFDYVLLSFRLKVPLCQTELLLNSLMNEECGREAIFSVKLRRYRFAYLMVLSCPQQNGDREPNVRIWKFVLYIVVFANIILITEAQIILSLNSSFR